MGFLVVGCANNINTEASQDETSEMKNEVDDGLIKVSKKQFQSSDFEIGRPALHKFSKGIQVSGTIAIPEKNKAKVSAYINGTVGKFNLVEGQWVKKGQVLFALTNPELITMQRQYLLEQEDLKFNRSEQIRLEALVAEKLTTNHQLLKVEADILKSKTNLAALDKELKLYGINVQNTSIMNLASSIDVVAPISGYIEQLNIMEGMYLESSISAMNIFNTSHKHLELQVLEKDIHLVKKGQKINFGIQGNPSQVYSAEVYLINEVVGEGHMINVHCHLDQDAQKQLKSGMYISADIVTESVEKIGLPKDAIITLGQEHYALKLVEEDAAFYIFQKQELNINSEDNGYVEVLSNLIDEDQYLVKGAYFLIM